MHPTHPRSTDLDSAGKDPDESADVRGEAARAARRLEVARGRVVAARGPVGTDPGGAGSDSAGSDSAGSDGAGSGGAASGRSAGSDAAWGGIDDVDDHVRAHLAPAVDRISRLADLAGAIADGTLSDEAAAGAARAIAAAQPHRQPR